MAAAAVGAVSALPLCRDYWSQRWMGPRRCMPRPARCGDGAGCGPAPAGDRRNSGRVAARSCAGNSRQSTVLPEEAEGRATSTPPTPTTSSSHRKARAVCTDVDGTLLTCAHALSEGNASAVREAFARGVPVVLATGKARGPWVEPLRRQLGFNSSGWTLNGPAVFLQGLLVCSEGGEVLHARTMRHEVVRDMMRFATLHGMTLTAYTTGDRIVAHTTNAQTDRLIPYNEPVPEAVGDMMDLLSSGEAGVPDAYKMILMADESSLVRVRPALEKMLGSEATVTKALPGMLEVLPPGASKADGVRRALITIGINTNDVIALGDGENDIEMLRMVRNAGGWSVAVANAGVAVKATAEHLTSSNDDDGFAEALYKYVL